jgi:hypothetical protein
MDLEQLIQIFKDHSNQFKYSENPRDFNISEAFKLMCEEIQALKNNAKEK